MKYCCERCGKILDDFLDIGEIAEFKYQRGGYGNDHFVLCGECFDAFLLFMNKPQEKGEKSNGQANILEQ